LTNAAWWARVVKARTARHDLLPQRVWPLRKDGLEAAIDLTAVPGIGAEIVLTVDGELRKARLFRSHEQAELVDAIADTRTMLDGTRGVNPRRSPSCASSERLWSPKRNMPRTAEIE
jgi:hypothetical protein